MVDFVIDQGKRFPAATRQDFSGDRGVQNFRRHATDLFNQQCWCWGRDVLRAEGNWLIELGFQQLKPPPERKECSSSVYQLSLPGGRCVVLRGFGAFYGDRTLGGIFVTRDKFTPSYLLQSSLVNPPWAETDLPKSQPVTRANRENYRHLTLGLIDWIYQYETDVITRLGLPYREMTLFPWSGRKRTSFPADQFAATWHGLAQSIAQNENLLS